MRTADPFSSGEQENASSRRCRKCDYLIEHLPASRCPECGLGFDLNDPSTYGIGYRRPRLIGVVFLKGAMLAAAIPIVYFLFLVFAGPPSRLFMAYGRLSVRTAMVVETLVMFVGSLLLMSRDHWYTVKLAKAVIIASIAWLVLFGGPVLTGLPWF